MEINYAKLEFGLFMYKFIRNEYENIDELLNDVYNIKNGISLQEGMKNLKYIDQIHKLSGLDYKDVKDSSMHESSRVAYDVEYGYAMFTYLYYLNSIFHFSSILEDSVVEHVPGKHTRIKTENSLIKIELEDKECKLSTLYSPFIAAGLDERETCIREGYLMVLADPEDLIDSDNLIVDPDKYVFFVQFFNGEEFNLLFDELIKNPKELYEEYKENAKSIDSMVGREKPLEFPNTLWEVLELADNISAYSGLE